MTWNKIKEHMDVSLVSLSKKSAEIFIGSISGRNLFIIPYIIASILKRRVIDRIDPKCITAQLLNIIKFFNDTVYVTDTIVICILK